MDATDFFLGDRRRDGFVLDLHGGKARLSCTTVERWQEALFRTLSCGAAYVLRLTRRVGVARTEREELEAAVQSSFGLKGIAELSSKIKSRTTTEVRLEEAEEVEESFTFKAPKCGRLTVLLYQLTRLYELSYMDTRFMHRDSWTRTIVEWRNRVHDASKRSENDPSCGCDRTPRTGVEGLVYLDGGRLSLLAGYRISKGGIDFPELKVRTTNENIADVLTLDLQAAALPSYLRFAAGEDRTTIPMSVRPYVAAEEVQAIEAKEIRELLANTAKNVSLARSALGLGLWTTRMVVQRKRAMAGKRKK